MVESALLFNRVSLVYTRHIRSRPAIFLDS